MGGVFHWLSSHQVTLWINQCLLKVQILCLNHNSTSARAGGDCSPNKAGGHCGPFRALRAPVACLHMFLFVLLLERGNRSPSGRLSNSPRRRTIQCFSVLSLAGESAALTGFPFPTAPQLHSGSAVLGGWLLSAALWLHTKSSGEPGAWSDSLDLRVLVQPASAALLGREGKDCGDDERATVLSGDR